MSFILPQNTETFNRKFQLFYSLYKIMRRPKLSICTILCIKKPKTRATPPYRAYHSFIFQFLIPCVIDDFSRNVTACDPKSRTCIFLRSSFSSSCGVLRSLKETGPDRLGATAPSASSKQEPGVTPALALMMRMLFSSLRSRNVDCAHPFIESMRGAK